jgi:hypothetical protein
MKKLPEGFINCLERGIIKGYVWDDDLCWAGKSYQKMNRYTSKLEAMNLIVKANSYGFYNITTEGIDYVKKTTNK